MARRQVARAKAVRAWNPKTGEFRSGQLDAEVGFEHWLLKFDGVSNNRDKELADGEFRQRVLDLEGVVELEVGFGDNPDIHRAQWLHSHSGIERTATP